MRKIQEELQAFLEDLGKVALTFVFTPYGKLHVHSFTEKTYYFKLRKFHAAGLLQPIRTVHYGQHFILSLKAKRILKSLESEPRRTDGLFTIVTFDIPVSKNRQRTIFRRFLQRKGFSLIQRSLLISSNAPGLELEAFAKELKLQSHIKIISGKIDKNML